MSRTLVCNLWAGPGASKSTTASLVFSKLKMEGINAELVREFAKELVWEGNVTTLKNQAYVSVTQYYRQCQPDGKVDVIVTDSPILLGIVYGGKGATPSFKRYLYELYSEFHNLNFFLVRNAEEHPYNPKGRMQSDEEAIVKDQEVLDLLKDLEVPFTSVMVERLKTADTIVEEIKKNLSCV